MAILISVVVACIVFYGVQLKGQWVTFWLTYLVTLSCGVGEPTLLLGLLDSATYQRISCFLAALGLHGGLTNRPHAQRIILQVFPHGPCSSCCESDGVSNRMSCLS